MKSPAEIVTRVLGEQLGCSTEEITRETKLRGDLGVDSLDDVEILMQLEEELDVEIPDDEAEKFLSGGGDLDVTVGQLIDFCTSKVAAH